MKTITSHEHLPASQSGHVLFVGKKEKHLQESSVPAGLLKNPKSNPRQYLRHPNYNLIGTVAAAILGIMFIMSHPIDLLKLVQAGIDSVPRVSSVSQATAVPTPDHLAPRLAQASEIPPESSAPSPQNAPKTGAIEWMSIPGGECNMGDTYGDLDNLAMALPVHRVTVRSFELSRTEITVEQYARFLTDTGHKSPDLWDEQLKNPNRPVVFVTWSDAASFAEWSGGRLPSEPEWEYAARGGLERMRWPWGNAAPENRSNFGHDWAGGEGWISSLSEPGAFPPNQYGLVDMAGNVWEWCADWFEPYSSSNTIRAAGSQTGLRTRVLRGGGWNSSDRQVRVDMRSGLDPEGKNSNIGFRIARDIPNP